MQPKPAWMLVLLAAAVGPARGEDFFVRPGGANQVVFVSKAPMEKFEGRTDRLEGVLSLDPGAVGDTITVRLEVDLASLDTGVRRRNQHMRENHLETAKFPKAVFEGATVLDPAAAKLEPGRPVRFDLEGTFSLHGVSRRLRCQAEVTYRHEGGRSILFQAVFPVLLSDYDIPRPQFLFLKLADAQDVRVTGVAVAAP